MDGEPQRFGRYQVDSRIAVGGMAEVYLAHTPPPSQSVAVKRIKPSFADQPRFVEMFLDEVRMCAHLDHPNVVRVLDFEGGRTPYLVMEYIDGPDLRRIIWLSAQRGMWVPPDLAAGLIAFAARGLHHAHCATDDSGRALDLIHRDLSPQNVMVTSRGQVKVVDFGIARAAGRNTRTRAGVIKGKYAYMSPEQVRGVKLDPRTDVYSLGLLLYELLTFENPFRRDDDQSTLIAVTDEAPKRPRLVRRDVAPDLETVVLKALSKDREARYPSALALAEALEASIATRRQPVTEAHLADFVLGLGAFDETRATMPPPEPVKEIDEASVSARRTELGLPAFVVPVATPAHERAPPRRPWGLVLFVVGLVVLGFGVGALAALFAGK